MSQVSFTAEELEKALAMSYLPVAKVTTYLGETAFIKRDHLGAGAEELVRSLDELGDLKSQIDMLSAESAPTDLDEKESLPADEKPVKTSTTGRWKKFLSSATTQITSISTKITSTTKITTLQKKESLLLQQSGQLFALAVTEGSIVVPDPIATLCQEVMVLIKKTSETEGSREFSVDVKSVFEETVGFFKSATGRAKRLISSEGLKTELRRLQKERDDSFFEIGKLVANLKEQNRVFVEISIDEIRCLMREIQRLKKLVQGEAESADEPSIDTDPGKEPSSEFLSNLARKTGGFFEMERLKSDLAERKQDLYKLLIKTGEKIYKKFEGNVPVNDALKRKCKPLKVLNFNIRQKELEVKRIMEEVSGDDLATMLHKRMTADDAEEIDKKIMERYGRHLTIMFTDLKDFTRKSAILDMVEMMEMMQEHDDLIIPIIEEHLGRIIKKIGDAIMAVFESPLNAVKAARAVQQKLRSRNECVDDPSRKIQVRIGINSGMVLEKEGDVYGDTVNMASRVEGLAKEEQVFITREVFDFLDEDEITCVSLPPQKVKGKDEAVVIFEVQY